MRRGVAPRVGRPSREERDEWEGPHGRVLRALSHRTRRRIVLLLAEGDKPVHEIADHFEVSRPMVSKHLRDLVQAGLVEGRPVGRERHYRLLPGEPGRTALRLARADEAHHDHIDRLRSRLESASGDAERARRSPN